MKFCPVVPPHCYVKLPTPPRGMFAFATHCWQGELPGYGDFYRSWHATALAHERGPLIIDNPIYEGLKALDRPELMRVAEILKPDFMIVPDVRGDWEATVMKYQLYSGYLGPCATAVIQGQSIEDIERCYDAYLQMGARRFAIPKDLAKIDGNSRFDMAHWMCSVRPDIEIHLLGGDWPYVDEAKAGQLYQVKSFDSAEPFNAAVAGKDIAKCVPPSRAVGWLDLSPRNLGDGFDHYFGRNIEVVERLAKCS
jgi:hypothetical protein